jgi:DNA-binding MarR family transcriptional regulator
MVALLPNAPQSMKIEEELQQAHFENEQVKAHVNVLFTASIMYNRMLSRLKKYGLSHEQFNVLRILRGQQKRSICQRDILSRMIDRSSNLTHIITRLKDKQLIAVEKSEVDRREYKITITKEGLSLLKKIDREQFADDSPPLNLLTDEEAAMLNNLLDKMRE